MKRCPTCNRAFSDPDLSFCLDDGTPLIKAGTPEYDSEATLISPSPQNPAGTPDHDAEQRQNAPSDWKGPVYRPPGQFQHSPSRAKRRVWPWVVGILALLFLVIGGLGIVAAIYLPNMMKAAQSSNQNSANSNANTASNKNTNWDSNSNTNANSSIANANANANANSNSNANLSAGAPAPTDQDQVLSDLTDLENEWTAANVNADKKKLARILADDYVSTSSDGSMHGKADYLRDIKADPTIKHWDFEDLKLTLKGDRATLKGTVRLERQGNGEDEALRFTDKFVWRDERWQAVGSEVSSVE
jgi:ketosteroid isomerase-like protein